MLGAPSYDALWANRFCEGRAILFSFHSFECIRRPVVMPGRKAPGLVNLDKATAFAGSHMACLQGPRLLGLGLLMTALWRRPNSTGCHGFWDG